MSGLEKKKPFSEEKINQKTPKYWCELGFDRFQVTLANCVECDKRAYLPEGSYEHCTTRKPYRMQIQEATHMWLWYLKTLWDSPRYFLVQLGKTVANIMGLRATPMADKDGWHLIWIKRKRGG